MSHAFKNSNMDLSPLQNYLQKQLTESLQKTQTQLLLIDEIYYQNIISLIGDFSTVPGLTQLQIHTIQSKHSTSQKLAIYQNISFFSFSEVQQINKILLFLKQLPQFQLQRTNINLLISPNLSFVCEQQINSSQVKIQVINIDIPAFIQDVDFISLQDKRGFAEVALNDQCQSSKQLFDTLILMQKLFGVFGEIYYKGSNASQLALQLYEKLYCSIKIDKSSEFSNKSKFSKLIIFDRQLDPLSPLLTPVSYEALLREFCQNQGTQFFLTQNQQLIAFGNSSVFNNNQQGTINAKSTEVQEKLQLQVLNLNMTADPVYSKIHATTISRVPLKFDAIAQNIKNFYQVNKNVKDQNIQSVKEVGQQVKFYRLLENKLQQHMKVFQQMLKQTDSDFYKQFDYEQQLIQNNSKIDHSLIEQHIIRQIALNQPLEKVLRFCCVYSLVCGGVDMKFYKQVIQNIVHMYGYQYFPVMKYLMQINWFCVKQKNNFSFNKACEFFGAKFQQDDVIFSSQQPISVRLLELICYSDIYQLMTGCDGDDHQLMTYLQQMLQSSSDNVNVKRGSQLLPGGDAETYLLNELTQAEEKKVDIKYNVVLCFVGGISQAELSAVRQLNEARNGDQVRFGDRFSVTVVASDLINGDELIKGFFDNQQQIRFVEEDGVMKEINVQEVALGRETGQVIIGEDVSGTHIQSKIVAEKKKRSKRI